MHVAVVPVQHRFLIFEPREDYLFAACHAACFNSQTAGCALKCANEIRERLTRLRMLVVLGDN
jgi:hypothetical protein